MSEKIINHQQQKILSGLEMASLSIRIKLGIAQQVSQLLKLHQAHMLQFSSQELIEQFINTGNAVAIWNDHSKQVIGFAKNYLWPGTNKNGQSVYEFGSWIVQPKFLKHGLGSQLAVTACKSAKENISNCQIVALCANDNQKAINLLLKLGASEVQKPNNVPNLLQTEEIVLDLTNIDDNKQL